MGLYEVLLSMSLLGVGMGTMLANFHRGGIMLVLRAVFNILVRNASPSGPMCFRCLLFNLSGPCELLFLLFYCLLDLSCSECAVMSLYFCVSLLMYLFVLFVTCLTVFVNCFVKQFAMCLGVVAVLFLNMMDEFSVAGGALLDRPCMVIHIMCVLSMCSQCASKCSFQMFCFCLIIIIIFILSPISNVYKDTSSVDL